MPHRFWPGDLAIIKRHRKENSGGWKGLYTVILTMLTAVKVDEVPTWNHHPYVKPVDPHADPEGYTPEEVDPGLWRATASP